MKKAKNNLDVTPRGFKPKAKLTWDTGDGLSKSANVIPRDEVCKMLSISAPTLWKYTNDGLLEGYKYAGRVFYKEQDIIDFLNSKK